MTADEIKHALTYSQQSPFFIRSHYVVPEVEWGMGFNHRLDLLSITMDSKTGTEIEIKVSKSDLKRDLKKEHGHNDERIKQLYFAGPVELREAFLEYAPPEAGIIIVYYYEEARWHPYQCKIIRRPKPRKTYHIFTDEEIFKLMRLGNMRYWSQFSKQFRKKPIITETLKELVASIEAHISGIKDACFSGFGTTEITQRIMSILESALLVTRDMRAEFNKLPYSEKRKSDEG